MSSLLNKVSLRVWLPEGMFERWVSTVEGSSGPDPRRSGGLEPALPMTDCVTLEKAVHLSKPIVIHSLILSFPTHFWKRYCGPGTVLMVETASSKTASAVGDLIASGGK